MAVIINEQQMIENNIFKYEERLNSKFSRFIDKTPNFVTYYHVNTHETMVDNGFQDVETIIGARSPIKFQEIKNFPLYGLESIVIQLEDTEHGLDGNYEGEAIVLPNTIRPVANDFFIINHLSTSDYYIFRVIDVDYDNIKSNNYYKIGFRLEYVDENKLVNLNNQVNQSFECVLENIGTENRCIIEEEYFSQLSIVDQIYKEISNTYLTLYYDERYNCILGDMPCCNKFYDPFMTMFINHHRLFNQSNDLNSLVLSLEGEDSKRKIKYEKSFYRFIEKQDIRYISNFYYSLRSGMNFTTSAFARWYDKSVQIIDITGMVDFDTQYILNDEFIENTKDHIFSEIPLTNLIQKFILKEEISIYDINDKLYDSIIDRSISLESFFFIPVILYIIKVTKENFLKSNSNK